METHLATVISIRSVSLTSQYRYRAFTDRNLCCLDPRLSGSKLKDQRVDLNDFKTADANANSGERRSSLGGASAVNEQAERIQAYTNNAMGVGNAMRAKLQKLRHPSSQRRPPADSSLLLGNTSSARNGAEPQLGSSNSQHASNFDHVQELRAQNMQLKSKMA